MKKLSFLVAALCATMFASAEDVEYTLTLTPDSVNKVIVDGSGYAAYNGSHSSTAYNSDHSKSMQVDWASNQVMPTNDGKIQGQKSNGYLYNTTNLGKIQSVTINDNTNNFAYVIGGEENPSSSVADGAYFKVSAGTSKASTATSIVIVFVKSDVAVPVASVSLDQESKSIEVGEEFTLKATVAPVDAANKNISWSSDAPAVASVVDGVVKGLSVGEANITVTTEDGEKTATCVVTVVAAVASDYVETAIEDIKTQDEVIITMTDSLGVVYALSPLDASSSAPKAVKMRVVENSLKSLNSSANIEDMLFIMSYVDSEAAVKFTVKDGTDYLYTSNDNNGVRVSKNASMASAWVVADGYLSATPAGKSTRYMGVFNASEFRAYTNTTGNTKKQELKFFVKSVGGEKVIPEGPVTALESVEVSNIYGVNGTIYGAEGARIYTITGMDVTEQNGSLNGAYIVRMGEKAVKVIVK